MTSKIHTKKAFFCLFVCVEVLRKSQKISSHVEKEPPIPGSYQYFRGVKCLAQGHNTAEVGFEPPTSRSGVRRSTTEPPRSPNKKTTKKKHAQFGTWKTMTKVGHVFY